MTAQRTRSHRERGTVTAEFALVLPAVVMVLLIALTVGSAVLTQVRCADAARAAARAASLGEGQQVVESVARELAGPDAVVSVERSGERIVVEVSRQVDAGPIALGQVRGRAVAVTEPGALGSPGPVS